MEGSSNERSGCHALLCTVAAAPGTVSEARQASSGLLACIASSTAAVQSDLATYKSSPRAFDLRAVAGAACPDPDPASPTRALTWVWVLVQHGLAMRADAALRSARAMAVAELAAEPKLREVMRDLFYQHAVLSTSARSATPPLPARCGGCWCNIDACSISTPCCAPNCALPPPVSA